MSRSEWFDVAKTAFKRAGENNLGLVAAGVSFYAFLALVPLLGAAVLTYGLVATPETVLRNLQTLTTVMPRDAATLVGEQLQNVVSTSAGKKGVGLIVALAVALFGARNGAGSLITALNIVYEEKEKRGFIKLNVLTLLMTAASVVAAIVAVIAIAALTNLERLFGGLPDILLFAGRLLSYVLVVLLGAAGAATLYRYAPSRPDAKWTWLTPGSLLAAIGWAVLTLGFGFYVSNLGNYNATYGSLGAIVVLLTWLSLTAYTLLLGAELNAELERRAAGPTTDEPGVPAIKGGGERQGLSARPVPASPPASPPPPTAPPHSFVQQRAGVRAGRLTGGAKVGLAAPALAALGLSWLKRGRLGRGVGMLASIAALVWLRRDTPAPKTPEPKRDEDERR